MEKDIQTAVEEQKQLLIQVLDEINDIRKEIMSAIEDIDTIKTKEDAIEWSKRHEAIDKQRTHIELL